DVEYVFEPHAAALPDLRDYLDALYERRPFMVALAKAELRTLRSRTALGGIWGVLDPLFQAAIYYFLYVVLRGNTGNQVEFLPVLIGDIFLFGLTTAALGEAGGSIRRSRGLMLSSTFPRAMLPITAVYKSLRQFALSAAAFAVIFPLVGGKLGAGLFVLPLLFALQTLMNVGIAMLVATFVVLVPDGTNVMSYVTRVLFFATPIIYPVALLPDFARLLVGWQPLFALFASYQAVLSGSVPSAGLILQTTLWTGALLILGGRTFLRHERQFALHL
ncbi:MAG: ABC transporter permease, partial [Acidimicrobiales bacterium]